MQDSVSRRRRTSGRRFADAERTSRPRSTTLRAEEDGCAQSSIEAAAARYESVGTGGATEMCLRGRKAMEKENEVQVPKPNHHLHRESPPDIGKPT